MAEKVTIMVLKVNLECPCCYKKVKKILCKFPQIRDQIYSEKDNKVTITVVCCNPERLRDKLCCKGAKVIQSIEIIEPPKRKEPEKTKQSEKEKPKPEEETKKKNLPKPPPPQEKPQSDPPKPPVQVATPPPPPVRTCCGPCSEGYGGGPCYFGYGVAPPPPPQEKPKSDPPKPPVQVATPPPPPPPVRTCCGPCSEGYGGGPCYFGYGVAPPPMPPPPPPPRRPCYDGYYGYGHHDRPCHVTRCDYYFCEENPQACSIM